MNFRFAKLLSPRQLVQAVLLFVGFTSYAHAYVDPGSALLLMQGLFAAVAGALAFFKKPWKMIGNLFKRGKSDHA